MKIVKFLVLTIFTLTLLGTGFARAEAVCLGNNNLPNFDSVVGLPKGTSSVYAQLNQTGKQTKAVLYLNGVEGTSCILIGTQQLNSDNWIRIGAINVSDQTNISILQMRLDNPNATQGASSPSVLIIPDSSNPCPDPNNCTIPFRGQSYSLTPKKISLNSDTLRVAQYSAINDQTIIKKTIYYGDNKVLYSRDGYGAKIDKRYAGYGEHNLKTNLITSDGQVLSIAEKVDTTLTIGSILSPLYLKNSSTIKTIGIISSALLIYGFIITMLRKFITYRRWRKNHIATRSITDQRFSKHTLSSIEMYDVLKKKNSIKSDIKLIVSSLLIPGLVVIVVITISIFLVGTFKIDGVSMETTLCDKSTQWMFKMPVTLAKFNKGNVDLKRGQVVVLHHDDNNLFVPATEIEKSFVIKRVIGLPGERIRVADGIITVFNKYNPEGINPDKGVSWESVIALSNGTYLDITLKEGELFVAGDNREYSIDSRFYGPVKSSDVVGIVLYKHINGLVPYVEK